MSKFLVPTVGYVNKRGALLAQPRIVRGDEIVWQGDVLLKDEQEAERLAIAQLAYMLLNQVVTQLREFGEL